MIARPRHGGLEPCALPAAPPARVAALPARRRPLRRPRSNTRGAVRLLGPPALDDGVLRDTRTLSDTQRDGSMPSSNTCARPASTPHGCPSTTISRPPAARTGHAIPETRRGKTYPSRCAPSSPETLRGGTIDLFGEWDDDSGQRILSRLTWSEITSNSAHWESHRSIDGGATWTKHWVIDFVRRAAR